MWWSNRLSPLAVSGSNRPRSRRAAIAIPTALPTPWPSGPVVVSTPGVWPCSGWPGVALPQVAQRLQVVELEAETGQVQLDVERQAGVPGRQHEPVAAGPVRVGGVVPHHLLEQQVRRGREAHRSTGVAVADLLHGVQREDPHGVDRALVELGPVKLGAGLLRHAGGAPLDGCEHCVCSASEGPAGPSWSHADRAPRHRERAYRSPDLAPSIRPQPQPACRCSRLVAGVWQITSGTPTVPSRHPGQGGVPRGPPTGRRRLSNRQRRSPASIH